MVALLAVQAAAGGQSWWAESVDPNVVRALSMVYGTILLLGLAANVVLALRLTTLPQRWPVRQARVTRRLLPGTALLGYFLFLVACFTLGILLQIALAAGLGPARAANSDGLFLFLHSLLFHWAALIGLGWLLAGRRCGWRAVFGLDFRRATRDLVLGAFGYVAMVPFVLFFAAIYMRALAGLGHEAGLQEVAQMITGESSMITRLYLYLMAVVLAPVVEELLFRGIAFPWLMKQVGPAPAMFAVSVLFAMIHFHVPGLVPLFVVSVALCFAYVHTGSILVPIVMHALFNGINLWALSLVG